MNESDLIKILGLPISDIAPVYGGVRGRTMASQHDVWWFEIREAGIKRIIDLREGGEETRIVTKCKMYGLDYFCYPVVSHLEGIRKMVELFPVFCRLIDEGNFYISCAMGLYRTDIALCCYWMFYGADKEIVPPIIRGYLKEDGHNSSKIMRILNAMYREFERTSGSLPFSLDVFKTRKKTIESQCSMHRMKIVFVCTGNACRSAAAEAILKKMIEDSALLDVEVSSCGTNVPVHGFLGRDEVMCQIAGEHGYSMRGIAIQATEDILNDADIIVVMTQHHLDQVTQILKYDNWNRIFLFNDFCFGKKTDLSDPHFQTEHVYRTCFDTIERGCKEIIKKLKQ